MKIFHKEIKLREDEDELDEKLLEKKKERMQ